MPRVHFTISSISKPIFGIVTDGYHKQADEKKLTKIRSHVIFLLKYLKSVVRGRVPPPRVATPKVTRSASPLIDPEFLQLAILVTEHLHRGYQVGHIGGAGVVVPYAECSLAPLVPNTIRLDQRYELSITPHKHSVEVSDIPEYAWLLRLKLLTHDVSLSALLNRLALWLYLFVQVYHYGWKIVLYHSETGDTKEITSSFFSKFSVDMPL